MRGVIPRLRSMMAIVLIGWLPLACCCSTAWAGAPTEPQGVDHGCCGGAADGEQTGGVPGEVPEHPGECGCDHKQGVLASSDALPASAPALTGLPALWGDLGRCLCVSWKATAVPAGARGAPEFAVAPTLRALHVLLTT